MSDQVQPEEARFQKWDGIWSESNSSPSMLLSKGSGFKVEILVKTKNRCWCLQTPMSPTFGFLIPKERLTKHTGLASTSPDCQDVLEKSHTSAINNIHNGSPGSNFPRPLGMMEEPHHDPVRRAGQTFVLCHRRRARERDPHRNWVELANQRAARCRDLPRRKHHHFGQRLTSPSLEGASTFSPH